MLSVDAQWDKESRVDRLLLRVGEAAEMLAISRAKAYQLLADGTLPSVKLANGVRRIPVEGLQKLIAQQLPHDGSS